MTDSFPIITRTRLEKAAADNGFDIEQGMAGIWLCFASSHARSTLWLTAGSGAAIVVAFSHPGVVAALDDYGSTVTTPLPERACGARGVEDFNQLHALLRRAMLLARTLPNALWETFSTNTAHLPRTTEAERLVVQRVGQSLFRDGLLELWSHQCVISGLAVPVLLRASHAKPWKDCATDQERLDAHNGLLLAAHLDAAFDAGLFTVEDGGRVVVSEALDAHTRAVLGLERPQVVNGLVEGHRPYLAWHRERVFERKKDQAP